MLVPRRTLGIIAGPDLDTAMRTPSNIEDQAAALLRNPGRVRAPELAKMIRDVNPTGLELAQDVERRRYKLKSQLQSLLIRKFRDDIAITRSATEFGVVGLRYRPANQDACHAVVSELDDDARSYVQLQVDLGAAEEEQLDAPAPAEPGRKAKMEPAAAPPGSTEDPRVLVEIGRAALAEYDYEQARHHFENAFVLSSGGTAEALALLDFLVANYAAYGEARALFDRVSEDALRNGEVRGLLALAAAHVGDFGLSALFLMGAAGDHAGAAWALLGQAALSDQRFGEADQCVAEGKKVARALPEIIALERELSLKRADARRPEEVLLEQLVAAGNDSAAEATANDILQRWPDSALARRVLRDIGEKKRAAQAEVLRRDGEQAFAAGDYDTAVIRWRKAQELGAAGLDEYLAAAKTKLAERARKQQVDAVVTGLQSGLTAKALGDYLELAEVDRQRVREQTRIGEIDLLEQLLDRAERNREYNAAVAAILALAEALTLDSDRDAVLVVDLLIPHERYVRRLQVGRDLLERARLAADAAVLARAEQRLADAREALSSGDLEGAQGYAAEAHRSRDVQVQRGAQMLLDEVRRRIESGQRQSRFSTLVAERKFFDAVRFARESAEAPSEDRTIWDVREAEAWRHLREDMRIEIFHLPPGTAAPEFMQHWPGESPPSSITADGSTYLWATCYERQLCIRMHSLATGANSVACMRAPERMDSPQIHVACGSVWVTGNGATLQLSADATEVVAWRSGSELLSTGESVDGMFLFPSQDVLWVSTVRPASREAAFHLKKLTTGRVVKELRGAWISSLLRSPTQNAIFAAGVVQPGRILAPPGQIQAHLPDDAISCAVHPAGGYVSLHTSWDKKAPVDLCQFDSAGRCLHRVPVPQSTMSSTVVTSHAVSSAYVISRAEAGAQWLTAYSLSDAPPALIWQVALPPRSTLAQDDHGVHVVLVCPTASGLSLDRLARSAPIVPQLDINAEAGSVQRAIVEVDAMLARGDGASALVALDTLGAWTSIDIHIAARLAEAVLLQTVRSPHLQVRKRVILAFFADGHARMSAGGLATNTPVELSWSDERLDDVARRARAWLEHGANRSL